MVDRENCTTTPIESGKLAALVSSVIVYSMVMDAIAKKIARSSENESNNIDKMAVSAADFPFVLPFDDVMQSLAASGMFSISDPRSCFVASFPPSVLNSVPKRCLAPTRTGSYATENLRDCK